MKPFSISIALIFCAYSFISAQSPDDFSFKKTYKISTPAEMSISTNDGFIKAYSKEINEIQVYFIVKKNDRVIDMDLDELEDHVDIDISSSNDELEIIIKSKETSWVKSWKDRYYVSMQILAPQKTDCNLKTSDGNIEMSGFSGDQVCKTSDGNIEVENITGELSARTSDGNIAANEIDGSIELQTSDGDLNVENIKGDITLKSSDGKVVVRNVKGDVNAITSDGNILLEDIIGVNNARTSDGNINFENLNGGLTAQTSDGDINGNFDKLDHDLFLKTSDGNISVTVPNGLGMDLTLRGEDINMRLDDFSGETSDHKIEGTIRGGGIDVELITSDGDINLDYN